MSGSVERERFDRVMALFEETLELPVERRSEHLERQVGDTFLVRLPPYPKGAKVEYYLRAADHSGRVETLPRVAPAGVYRFTVAD